MLHQEACFQGVRMVEVDLGSLLEGEVDQVLVVGVVMDDGNRRRMKAPEDLLDHGGLARSATSRHSQYDSVVHLLQTLIFFMGNGHHVYSLGHGHWDLQCRFLGTFDLHTNKRWGRGLAQNPNPSSR